MNRTKLNRLTRRKVVVREPADFSPTDKTQFLAELKLWGEMKGYKPGWPSVQYKERFGAWPAWSMRDNPSAMNVSAETMAYLNKRKREWQKAKRAERERLRAEAGVMPCAAPVDDYIELGDYRI